MDFLAEAQSARRRIAPYIRRTSLEYSKGLSLESGAEVFLKLENYQVTGSFKARGALSALSALDEAQRTQGVITASTGNHGAAVAYGATMLKLPGTIVLPSGVSSGKLANIQNWGSEIVFFGTDSGEAECHARELATQRGQHYLSPYNDAKVIAGQSTIALEMTEDEPRGFDAVFVAVGGGGLISGVGGVLKAQFPKIKVVGCSPVNSSIMANSVKAGKISNGPSQPTLSDGTAGGVDEDSITFPLCQSLVDDWVLVSEFEIKSAMRRVFDLHSMVIEGAAGVALAGFWKVKEKFAGQRVAVVLCGSRVDRVKFLEALGESDC